MLGVGIEPTAAEFSARRSTSELPQLARPVRDLGAHAAKLALEGRRELSGGTALVAELDSPVLQDTHLPGDLGPL